MASKLINLFGNRNFAFTKILVFKQDEIGDMVTALHIFKHLHKAYPDAQIDLVCKNYNRIWFKYIDYVQCIESQKGKYDLIVDLRGDFKSLFYAIRTWPKYRLDRGSVRFKNKFSGGQKNELITNFEIINPIMPKDTQPLKNSISISDGERVGVEAWLQKNSIKQFVLLHIGARDLTRRWPLERFQSIIDLLNSKGYSCILVGGSDDNELNLSCLEGLGDMNHNIAGQFNLLELAAFCEKAKLFIGNESGPLHVAAAQNTPIIGLYGPGVKEVFYPKSDKNIIHHYFLLKGHKNQDLTNSTIFKISVEEVQESITELLFNEES